MAACRCRSCSRGSSSESLSGSGPHKQNFKGNLQVLMGQGLLDIIRLGGWGSHQITAARPRLRFATPAPSLKVPDGTVGVCPGPGLGWLGGGACLAANAWTRMALVKNYYQTEGKAITTAGPPYRIITRLGARPPINLPPPVRPIHNYPCQNPIRPIPRLPGLRR